MFCAGEDHRKNNYRGLGIFDGVKWVALCDKVIAEQRLFKHEHPDDPYYVNI